MDRDHEPLPTDAQREALCAMFAEAFIEARALGWEGKADQAADLADAFHNLPKEMYGWGGWSLERVRSMLKAYQDKYRGSCRDYLSMLDRIFAEPA